MHSYTEEALDEACAAAVVVVTAVRIAIIHFHKVESPLPVVTQFE
jgi:hypothetical protein